ncbi:methylcobalamin:coenzyme M methyltransferase [Anaerohalosphaera lusitana]|uniref:Methylcobalamin:coenzyme M methyltransferase n=1 Tax=Anaerohalosphaera lusitana TaxID=1936003 RepID=A0A1U9NN56_9BACT|nr:uroporphyrinogen decarboxylase family protein [Anaerohalosphaera lusitana]AQT69341.1 methylcobalamin:coenzyme M methyltransferase [Anaerohalosphaera lusitana]
MTQKQWETLLRTINGELIEPMPVGFIIDSPWLPEWNGIDKLEYFTSDTAWFETNLRAVKEFPDVLMLPGFWAEFGMCTEPSAFGAKCSWYEHELPYADRIISGPEQIDGIKKPKATADGLAPFVLKKLKRYEDDIQNQGHAIRFAIARGPLNIASFLMGATEFLMGLRTDTDRIHRLLRIVTDYTKDWLLLQKEQFNTIDGIFLLDDIVGFCGEPDFKEFAQPYLTELFNCFDASVKFFHNDADGSGCAPHLAQMGVNLFNYSFMHSIQQMKEWTNNEVTLLGNIPPRDVMAIGMPDDVKIAVDTALSDVQDRTKIILSCGGGMVGGTPSRNITAMTEQVAKLQ